MPSTLLRPLWTVVSLLGITFVLDGRDPEAGWQYYDASFSVISVHVSIKIVF